MIHLKLSHKKSRAFAHKALQTVSQDMQTLNVFLNKKDGTDIEFVCPEVHDKELNAVLNESEIWFGRGEHKYNTCDLNWGKKQEIHLKGCDERTDLLFKLLSLAICEQFPKSKFTTREDFKEAIEIYEYNFGSISNNACKSLGIQNVI